MILELRSVSAYWHPKRRVSGYDSFRPISLKASPGEWVLIAGVNGSGKSTLLHAIAGTIPFVGGEIIVGSVNLPPNDLQARFTTGVQVVPQHSFLPGPLYLSDVTDILQRSRPGLFNEGALDNLHDKLRFHGLVGDDLRVRSRVFDLLLAVHSVPAVLLLDEFSPSWPTYGVKPSQVYSLIKDWIPRTAVLFVDHNIAEAAKIADRILWLRPGEPPATVEKRDRVTHESLISSLGSEIFEVEEALQHARPVRWQGSIRLDRSPIEQLRLAIQARGDRTKSVLDMQAELLKDFPFLGSEEPAESLSGGQRTILMWFLLEFSGLGELPEALLRHLDRHNRARIEHWSTRK